MASAWVLADAGDEVANNLRVACASFLSQASKEDDVLPPGSQHAADFGALTTYKCSVTRPFPGLDIVWTYVWYKAIPAWSSDSLWAVRVDHFVPHFLVPLRPAANDAVNGDNGLELEPVTFFTTKTLLPGGRHTYSRYVHDGGAIYPRSLLGFLDPLATADINATNPSIGQAYHYASETQASPAASGMPYSNASLNANPSTVHVHHDSNFVKSDHGALQDPFKSPGSGPRSGRAGFGEIPGGNGNGNGNGNRNYSSPGIGVIGLGRDINQLAHLGASNAEPRKQELLLKQLSEANRKFKMQEKVMRAQSKEIEALRKKNLEKDSSA